MNCMEQVAKMLGVELDEEFNIEGKDYKYKISKNGVFICYEEEWYKICDTLIDILMGKREIIKKPILDKKEKEYLSAVIAPFRNRVEGIVKYVSYKTEYIRIKFRDIGGNRGYTSLPSFEKDTMYKGMKVDKWYSLKELEL